MPMKTIKSPEELLQNYEAALATQDWRSVAPLIHAKACVTFSTGQSFRGKDQVRQAFERNFASIQDEHYAISDLYWVFTTETYAVCIYAFQWQGIIEGKAAAGSGRGTSILVNEGGKWYLLAEHLGPGAG
jgi:ketosteroid isomerase-like protein